MDWYLADTPAALRTYPIPAHFETAAVALAFGWTPSQVEAEDDDVVATMLAMRKRASELKQ